MNNSKETGDDEFLYAKICDHFEKLISNRILKTGDKLLSVRALSKEQGISLSTAFKAYSELEIKGLIEARPKSGYYVKYTPREFPKPSAETPKQKDPKKVSLDEMLTTVYENVTAEGVVRFSIAAPSITLVPRAKLNKVVAEVLRKNADSCVNYGGLQGDLILRKQIARHSFNWGGVLTEQDIVTTQGCIEALSFCLKAITKPGDTVAIEEPTYFLIYSILRSLGLKALEIPVNPETGVDLNYLERAINKTKIKACLFITNFNNPTGAQMPEENKKGLVKMLAKREIPLIEDDIYGELYFGKIRPRTCKSYDKKGLVLLCSSISKSLAPGYRVGWCIPGRFKEEILKIKFTHTFSSAAPTHAAIGRFFETGRFDLHMRHLRKALHTQCLRYTQAIAEYFPPNTKISRPQGGYVLWIELDKKINAFELYQSAMEYLISVAPGQIFTTDGQFENYIRISFGLQYTDAIDKSLRTLGRLVKEKSGWKK